MGRYRGKGIVPPGEIGLHPGPVVGQAAGTDQCPSAVPPRSRQHNNPLATRVAAQETAAGQVRKAPPGVLHHLDQVYPVIFDHGAVDLDHLRRINKRDIALWLGKPHRYRSHPGR